VFTRLEWPAAIKALPGVAVLVFSLCFTSFAVVLTLGGGPRATTIEVAIYQALRFDFDIPTAVVLALLQIALCAALLALSTAVGRPTVFGGRLESKSTRFPDRSWLTWLIIGLGAAFTLAPLLAVAIRGLNPSLPQLLADAQVWHAIGVTAVAGVGAGILAVALAIGLLLSARHLQVRRGQVGRSRVLASLGMVVLVMPGVVLSAGLFLLLRSTIDVFAHGLWLIIAVNALIGLPFACAVLHQPLVALSERADKLCAALGITGWARTRVIEWPVLRRPLGLSLGLCSALAAGDLTAIALFGSQQLQTLPMILYQLIGSYRLAEAAATALLLLLLALSIFTLFDRGLGGSSRAQT
ncbi:MAG: thiamine/thiamine pyrophosphate ABC transporter permease ThiP, partial [Pseudomonadota bacterium]